MARICSFVTGQIASIAGTLVVLILSFMPYLKVIGFVRNVLVTSSFSMKIRAKMTTKNGFSGTIYPTTFSRLWAPSSVRVTIDSGLMDDL